MQFNKTYTNYGTFLLSKKNINSLKFKHLCLKNNKYSSVNNSFYVSKYVLKDLLTNNKAQNCKVNSW